MKIHLKQIPAEGLRLEGEEMCPIPELEKDGVRCVGPLHYNLDLGVSNGALWANGSLTQPVEMSCVSCLEKFVHVIEVRDFALHTELGGPETVDDCTSEEPANGAQENHQRRLRRPPTK